jgi:hypothetical protein
VDTYTNKLICLLGVLFSLACAPLPAHSADFLLNFYRPPNSDPTGFWFGGLGTNFFEGSCAAGVSCSGGDGTAFSQEMVNINGVDYWRNVVGDPASGFAMEYYTRFGRNVIVPGESTIPFGLDGGGQEQAYNGAICSTSQTLSQGNSCGNSLDPLSVAHDSTYTGTGTQNPDKMVFRMILSGSGMDMEIYKPLLENKPRITQSISDTNFHSTFVTDMRGISYSDKNTPAPVVINQTVDDPQLPQFGAADFTMSMADRTNVTAGRYTFTPGAGWNTSIGWDKAGSWFDRGTYDYAEGNGFDAYNFDWGSVFDYSQNTSECNKGSRNNAECPGRP